MASESGLTVEFIKVLPSLITSVVVGGLLVANAGAIRRLLAKAGKLKALGVEIEAAGATLDKAVAARGLERLVAYHQRVVLLRRLSQIAPLLSGARVLWVDDAPEDNRHEIELLKSLEVRVDLASSSEAAEQFLRNHHYLLMLTDIRRGGVDDEGIKFLPRTVQAHIDVPTIGYVGTDQNGLARPPYFFGLTHRPDHLFHLVCDVAQREGS